MAMYIYQITELSIKDSRNYQIRILLMAVFAVFLIAYFALNSRVSEEVVGSNNWLLPKDEVVDITVFPSANYTRIGQACYMELALLPTNIDLLEDVMTSSKQPSKGQNIFFHVTNCLNGTVLLSSRQAIAIESAAATNPDCNIFVLFASPVGFLKTVPRPKIVQALDTYDNVHFRNLNLWKYAKGTPVEDWIHKPDLFNSTYVLSHMSDLLRLLSLFRYGGTHVDLDFIVRCPFKELSVNFAGFEWQNIIAGGLLNFDHQGVGHGLAEECLKEFAATFNGTQWAHNGPQLITRVVQRICRTMNTEKCPIFTSHPQSTFYAIHFTEWYRFFESEHTEKVLVGVNQSMAVHFWNKMSANRTVRLGEGSAYELLAKQFSPRVYRAIEEQDSVF